MSQPYYVTTPIYYVNASPHLGHAYTTVIADALKRFHQMQGREAFMLTGTDEHGDKIALAAAARGIEPAAYADEISAQFQAVWPQLDIESDDFIRTTQARHQEVVTRVLSRVHEAGDIYFGKYGGHYCYGCERFYTEKELVDGKCPDHQTEPTYIEEENYFFRMGKYQDWLIDHIEKNPDFIRPQRYRNEALALLREPLEDLCISRPKSRLTWGITLPFDENYVTYVWFDALINYISALGWPDGERFKKYWGAAEHVIAKDILKPHAIFWPLMLKSAGIPVYQHLNVHGFWKIGESKMSKSVGNVVQALSMKDVYGLDAFRYFLMREMAFGLDSSFGEAALVERLNSDLANDLGNLAQRTLAMVTRFSGGQTSPPDFTGELSRAGEALVEEYAQCFERLAFHKALEAVWAYIGQANKFIDTAQPWALAKDEARAGELGQVLAELVYALAQVAGLIHPVMPATAAKLRKMAGLPEDLITIEPEKIRAALAAGVRVNPGPPLFPRVELGGAPLGKKDKKAKPPQPQAAPREEKKAESLISYDEFAKVRLRVGRVLAAEKIKKADKLLKLSVDLGEAEPRTIVAGIAKAYAPEDLIGQNVLVVANLAPAKLMGVESNGMLLAATDDEGLTLATFARPVGAGAKVS